MRNDKKRKQETLRFEPAPPKSGAPYVDINLSMKLLVMLGSIAVHADEMLSPNGHDYDVHALRTCIDDAEVKEFVATMTKKGFMPVKR